MQSALAMVLGEDTPATIRAHVEAGKVVFTISSVPAEDLDELCAALETA